MADKSTSESYNSCSGASAELCADGISPKYHKAS